MVQPDRPHRPQNIIQRMRFTCGYLGHKHTLIICNTYCSSTEIQVALPDGLDTNFTLVHGYSVPPSLVRAIFSYFMLPFNTLTAVKTYLTLIHMNLELLCSDRVTKRTAPNSEYGTVKTTDEQSPPLNTILGSNCHLSSQPGCQTPIIKLQ